jgi:lipopolysaccharide biosynthesis glycosyltransferase
MPLAVALYSAVSNLKSVDRVQIVVADVGITSENRQKITQAVTRTTKNVSIDFKKPDTSVISTLPQNSWHNTPNYAKLILGNIVPKEWERMIFLDGDLVVKGNLMEVWEKPMNGNIIQAVRDYRVPTLSYRHSLRETYADSLEIDTDHPYFNMGVMLIDLTAWREEEVGLKSMRFLQEYAQFIEYPTQDATNPFLIGRVGELSPKWNVQVSTLPYYGYPDHETSENREKQKRLHREAAILHFTGASKPWHYLYRRSMDTEFFHFLIESGWFSPWVGRRWVWGRHFSHFALDLIPDPVLTAARNWAKKGKSR